MRIAVLTTDTLHHRYFLRRLEHDLPKGAQVVLAIFESSPYPWRRNAIRHAVRNMPNLWRGVVCNPYLQPRSFARRQDAFEKQRFFPDGDSSLPTTFPVELVPSVNHPTVRRRLARANPEIIYVYGTGKIAPEIFTLPPLGSVNAHGGRLPGYRGLDTNLWAAYERRPEDMYVTLHKMDDELDTGAVYLDRRIPLHRDMTIYSLRYFSTLFCVDLFLELTRKFLRGDPAQRSHERENSRYFGPMPWVLKKRTDRILRLWTADMRVDQ